MESLYLNEMLRILFLTFQNNPKQFTSLFNDSKSIAAFDFDPGNNEFVRISSSFNTFLGITEYICGIKEFIVNNIIHPNDLDEFKEYFSITSLFSNRRTSTSISEFKRMKCRLKHSNGYWKFFKIISLINTHISTNYHHQIGFIVDDMNPGYFETDKGFSHIISERSQLDKGNQLHVTNRENEILVCLSNGMIAKEIASSLNISVTTVISHRKNLINKFQVKNTAELIKEASRLMIV